MNKNDDSIGHEEDGGSKMPPAKRKIKIIQNAKGAKGAKVKNSHMVILKSIKQKLNLQGMLKDNEYILFMAS